MLMNQDGVRARISALERRLPQPVRVVADVYRHQLNERSPAFFEHLESVLEHFAADAHCSMAQVKLFSAQADFFLNLQGFQLLLDEQLLASFVPNTPHDAERINAARFAWLVSPFVPYEHLAMLDGLGQWAASHGVMACNPFAPEALQQHMAMVMGQVLSEPRTALLIMEEYRQWLGRELPMILQAVQDALSVQGARLSLTDTASMLGTHDNNSDLDRLLAQYETLLEDHALRGITTDQVNHALHSLSKADSALSAVIERVQKVFARLQNRFWLHDCQRRALCLLQIPAVRFALEGHDFSQQDHHLFRQLLSLVGELGHGWSVSVLDNPRSDVCTALQRAVLSAMRCRGDAAGLVIALDELLCLFSDVRMNTVAGPDIYAVEMLRDVGASRAVINNARLTVATIAGNATAKHAAAMLWIDLIRAWSDVMLKVLLDHGQASDSWAAAVTTLESLVAAVAGVNADGAASGQQSLHDLSELIRALRSGLEKQYSSLETGRLLGKLEELHLQYPSGAVPVVPTAQGAAHNKASPVRSVSLPGEPGEWFRADDTHTGIWQLLGSSVDGDTIYARGIDGNVVHFSAAAIMDFLPSYEDMHHVQH